MKEYSLTEIKEEKTRLEKEISRMLMQSIFNDSLRFCISNIRLSYIDSIGPAKHPFLVDVKIDILV